MRHKPDRRDNDATEINPPTVAGEPAGRRNMKQSSIVRRPLRCRAPGLAGGGAAALLLAAMMAVPPPAQAQLQPVQAARPAVPSLDQRVRRLEDALDDRLRRDADGQPAILWIEVDPGHFVGVG